MSKLHPATGRATQLAEALLHSAAPFPTPEWWRGAMLYEVYLPSFYDTTASGRGDLPGVIEKLDYIRDLGVDGFWLSPFYPSPRKDYGYDIVDFCAVDELYGTLDDFRLLVEEAHNRDLRILIDFVPGHTSEEHPWYLESREGRDNAKSDWYIWADAGPDGGPPNNWLSSFGGTAWRWEPRRAQYVYHPFLPCQPALDLTNQAVMNAVVANLSFWLDLGVDGFRLDAVQCLCCDEALRSNPPSISDEDNGMVGGGPNNPFKKQLHLFDRDVPEAIPVLERLRDTVSRYDPERVLIGELADVDASRFAVKYTMQGERLHAVYDFDLINGAQSFEKWVDVLDVRTKFMASGWSKNVFTNHDSIRAVSNLLPDAVRAGRAADAAKVLLFLQGTLIGGGILFQGDELGLTQPDLPFEDIRDPWAKAFWPEFRGRDGVRTPLPWRRNAKHGGFSEADKPWLHVPEEHLPMAIDVQHKEENSVLNFTRRLLKWRGMQPALLAGTQTLDRDAPAPLVSFTRSLAGDRMKLIVNLGLEPRELSLARAPKLDPISSQGANWNGRALRLEGLAFAAY